MTPRSRIPNQAATVEDEIRKRAVAVVDLWRARLDLEGASIEVQVGDLSEHGSDKRAATFGSPDGKEAIIAIDPSVAEHEDGLEHIVLHEMVHVAHGLRFGEDKEAALEWLVETVATLLEEKFDQPAGIPNQGEPE